MPLLAYLWIAFALNYVDRQMVYSMLPALKADLRFDVMSLGLIGSVFQWVYTISMPVAGRVADVWRPAFLIKSSLVLWSLAAIGCGLSMGSAVFLVCRAMMAMTEALYYPAALLVIAGHYSEQSRSKALGMHQSAQLFGAVVGGSYGGWAADNIGWRNGFLLAGLVGVIYGCVLAWGMRDVGSSSGVRERRGSTADSVLLLLRSRGFVMLCAAFAAFCAMQWVFFAWFPTHLTDKFGLGMTAAGWNGTLFIQGSAICGILAGGIAADRVRRSRRAARLEIAALGILLSAPFAYLAFAAMTLGEARAYSAAFGFFGGLLAANAFAAAYDMLDAGVRGLAGGVLNMMGGISSAIMIYVAGLARGSVGIAGLMIVLAVLAGATALYLLIAAQRKLA